MRESAIEKECRLLLEDRGGKLLKLSGIHMVGIADRLALIPIGKVVFMEFKTKRGRLTHLQKWWRDWLVLRGFRHVVIDSVEQFVKELRV